jgi:hypothetical protein
MFIARRICRRKSATICYESPNDQFYFVHHRLYGFCDVPEEGLLETTIWTLLLGPHDATVDCCLEVSIPFDVRNLLHSRNVVISSLTTFSKASYGSGFQPHWLFAMIASPTSGV